MERETTGEVTGLAVDAWAGPATPEDLSLLDGVVPAVLDIGCGPGRIAAALSAAGTPALGIDVSPAALRAATDSGAIVLQRSVFDHLPGEGRWATVLLLDGNIGIGGDPAALMGRVADLLGPGGRALIELDATVHGHLVDRVRIHCDHDPPGPWFDWAWVGVDGVHGLAASVGLDVHAVDHVGGRTVARLGRPAAVHADDRLNRVPA